MNSSICNFMPDKTHNTNIRIINFVYETNFSELGQPFFHAVYRIHLITKGSGVVIINSKKHKLSCGSIFISHPGYMFEIEATDDFEYMYISFMGAGVDSLLDNLQISMSEPVYDNFEHMIDFWESSIKRISLSNSHLLAESVLLYTLSYINNDSTNPVAKNNSLKLFEDIVEYTDMHYRDADMCIKKVAEHFSYTEKYLSSVFKKHMNLGFNEYMHQMRLQYAIRLMENNINSISSIASLCGYNDPLYFSKVFKKHTGMSPSKYLKTFPDLK